MIDYMKLEPVNQKKYLYKKNKLDKVCYRRMPRMISILFKLRMKNYQCTDRIL